MSDNPYDIIQNDLVNASRKGDTGTVNLLLYYLKDDNRPNADYNDALIEAVKYNHKDIINSLLNDPHVKQNYDDISLPDVIPKSQENAINKYTYETDGSMTPWHVVINDKLKNHEKFNITEQNMYNHLMKIFRKVSTVKKVYRGVYHEDVNEYLSELFGLGQTHNTISHFLSTSTDRIVAANFNIRNYNRENKDYNYELTNNCCIMEIILHPGVKAAYFIKHSGFSGENEVLIAPGQKICLENVTRKGNMNVITCHIYP